MKDSKQPTSSALNKRKDYVTNKLLLAFTLAFAQILLLLNIGKMMKNVESFLRAWNLSKIVSIAALVVAALGIVIMAVEHSKNTDTSLKLLSGKNILVGALFIALCTIPLAFYSFSQSMLTLLYIFVPAVVVMYIIYYSYQREFFMIALSCVVGGISIWLLSSTLVNSKDAYVLIAAAVMIVLSAVFTIRAQIGNGKVSCFGREFAPFKADARYGIIYLTFALVLMLMVAAFLAADLAMYFTFGLIAYMVLMGIYYTVKLI